MEKKIRVLLVDDEEQFVLNMAKLLSARGFEVSTAFSGHEAVDTVKYGGGFDVVVLDINMPDMDGITTLERIKKWAPDTEVIMLTGHATLDSGVRAIRKGAYDYLMKPCDIDDLTVKIRDAHQVENMKRRPVLWRRNKVNEITLFFFERLETEYPLDKAMDLFGRRTGGKESEALFIMDREDRLQGFITRLDLINEAEKGHAALPLTWNELQKNPQWLPEKPLSEIMHHEIIAAHPEESLTDVADRMIKYNFRTLPVVEEGRVIGIVRIRDIFLHIDHEKD